MKRPTNSVHLEERRREPHHQFRRIRGRKGEDSNQPVCVVQRQTLVLSWIDMLTSTENSEQRRSGRVVEEQKEEAGVEGFLYSSHLPRGLRGNSGGRVVAMGRGEKWGGQISREDRPQ